MEEEEKLTSNEVTCEIFPDSDIDLNTKWVKKKT